MSLLVNIFRDVSIDYEGNLNFILLRPRSKYLSRDVPFQHRCPWNEITKNYFSSPLSPAEAFPIRSDPIVCK